YLLEAPGLVAATLGIVLLAKPLAALAFVLLLRYPPYVALAVAVALAQTGEFSFILAALGKQLGLLPDGATHALVAAALASISLNPLLYRLPDGLEAWARRRPRVWRWLNAGAQPGPAGGRPAETKPPAEAPAGHTAVVVGYGPVGRTVARLLRDNGV